MKLLDRIAYLPGYDRYWAARNQFRNWWRRPDYARVGNTVCCCDCVHRTITSIDDDLAWTDDGRCHDIFHCMEAVQVDGSCHTKYEEADS